MEKTKLEPTESVEQTLPTDSKLSGEPDIPRDDSTPKLSEQASSKGFECQLYHFGKLEGDGCEYFNPSIVQRPDGYWMLTRRSEPHPHGFKFGQNAIWAFMLDDTGKIPKMANRLNWPVDDGLQHFEDPRGFYHPGINQTCVGACTFIWNPDGTWTGAHQCFGAFDENWQCRKMDYPRVGGNPGVMRKIDNTKDYEKNWLWFLFENKLHLLYKANPWLIVGFGNSWNERKEYRMHSGGVQWAHGDIRGGTNPVQVGEYFFTFHHSSLSWIGRYRRYYAGCLAFDARPPFRPKLITKEPLLIGSQNDVWMQRKPLVVFPCGAVHREGKWLVSLGVNDMRAAWMEIEHDKLLSMMSPIDDGADSVFMSSGLSKEEQRKQKLRENLAKARAARAAKKLSGGGAIRGGETRPRLIKRRRRRKYRRIKPEHQRKALRKYQLEKTLAKDEVKS